MDETSKFNNGKKSTHDLELLAVRHAWNSLKYDIAWMHQFLSQVIICLQTAEEEEKNCWAVELFNSSCNHCLDPSPATVSSLSGSCWQWHHGSRFISLVMFACINAFREISNPSQAETVIRSKMLMHCFYIVHWVSWTGMLSLFKHHNTSQIHTAFQTGTSKYFSNKQFNLTMYQPSQLADIAFLFLGR